tara:strand:+ start:5168 stop:5854 length:687 start_codon:yes stop_codon:yes gene_type:complete
MNIVIDLRENAIKDHFKDNKPEWIEYSQLPLGDIIIKDGDNIIFIIERKTLDDLSHSIKDGRYHEQKYRLLEHFSRDQIIYLIEGTKSKGFYQGAIINTILRDNIKVIRSVTLKESIQIIIDLYEKAKKGTFKKDGVETKDYSQMVKLQKKNHFKPFHWYISSLKTIPGVSEKIAQTIASEYKTMMSLFDGYLREGPQLLENLKIDGKRKLGKISEKIYNYLVDSDEL